jgi:hypothetical protein
VPKTKSALHYCPQYAAHSSGGCRVHYIV